MVQKNKKKLLSPPMALLLNIVLAYLMMMLSRVIFVLVNYSLYGETIEKDSLWQIVKGALLFDTSALCYLNIPYILLLLIPIHYKENRFTQFVTKIFFVAANGVGIIANLADTVYVPFTGRRTTWSLFSEFAGEQNMAKIVGVELLHHWYLTIIGIVFIVVLYRFYSPASGFKKKETRSYYITRILTLVIVAPCLIIGMRGGVGKAVRPITLSNANQYVNRPEDAAIILNTPFSMIRTIGKNSFTEKKYFERDTLPFIYSPIHHFDPKGTVKRKNVVVFILESFGKEYIGAYNKHRNEPSLTPFLDSLINKSLSYKYSYGNGRKSIDGMPSVLSGIPMFIEPFFLTPAALNRVSGLAGELGKTGYRSAFFHGAPNGSMGFQAFARATGFNQYYGMDEYLQSQKHGGKGDYDGTWAIWDEPFFDYFAETMGTIPEPFITTLFSASSHHPFAIPEKYSNRFPEGKIPIHKCIRYTDEGLKRFFEKAKNEPWFNNTIFVITADHSNQSIEPRYKNSSGFFEVPVIFYSPDENAPFTRGINDSTIAQQIDILPTTLEIVGYNKPFLAFGKSLISTPNEKSFAINYINNTYQYYKGNYLLMFDGEKTIGFYDIRNDELLYNNIKGKFQDKEKKMEIELKAIIQDYMSRMVNDNLTIN